VLGAAPDFYVQTSTPIEEARLKLVGTSARVRWVGPLEADGTLKVSASANRDEVRKRTRCLEAPRGHNVYESRAPLDGLYAGYVVGDEGASVQSYALWIAGRKTPVDPGVRALEPRGELTFAERNLRRWYPEVAVEYQFQPAWFERIHRMWMDLPKALIVFLKEARDGQGAKVGTPLAVVGASHNGELEVMAPNGSKYRVREKQLSTTPLTPIASAEPHNLAMSESDLPRFLSDTAREAFLERQKKFNACYDKALRKLDPDGVAGRFDIVTYRAGKVVKIEGMAAKHRRIADKRCKAKAYDRYVKKVAKKTRDALAAEHEKWSNEIRARIASLFNG
jgi:hypothetical protein